MLRLAAGSWELGTGNRGRAQPQLSGWWVQQCERLTILGLAQLKGSD
jgi:hypothetical protein